MSTAITFIDEISRITGYSRSTLKRWDRQAWPRLFPSDADYEAYGYPRLDGMGLPSAERMECLWQDVIRVVLAASLIRRGVERGHAFDLAYDFASRGDVEAKRPTAGVYPSGRTFYTVRLQVNHHSKPIGRIEHVPPGGGWNLELHWHPMDAATIVVDLNVLFARIGEVFGATIKTGRSENV